jgi:hypothetical protein
MSATASAREHTQAAKAYLKTVVGFRSSNWESERAVRAARYEAWSVILLEADLSMPAYMAYRRMVELCYGSHKVSASAPLGGRP